MWVVAKFRLDLFVINKVLDADIDTINKVYWG